MWKVISWQCPYNGTRLMLRSQYRKDCKTRHVMLYLTIGVGTMKKIPYLIKHLPYVMFNFLLSLSASAYVIAIFLIKEGTTFCFLPQQLKCVSYIAYLIAPVLIAWLCLHLAKKLSVCGMECQIEEVELASHSFLPNYLGYFFVALSIPNTTTFIYVYIVILVFTHLSQALSFNPLFLLFGYQFYFITGEDRKKVFLITKQKMKAYQDVELNNLRRINDFTFIDMG